MRQTWNIYGTSVKGVMHNNDSKPCQDACNFRTLPGNNLVIAVSDGASTAEYADIAANTAVQSVVNSIVSDVSNKQEADVSECRKIMYEAIVNARNNILNKAFVQRLPSRSFASTLTVVLVLFEHFVTAQIGDGAAVAQTLDNTFCLLAEPQRGEFANETYFLTDDNAMSVVDIRTWQQDYKSIIVMTDGITRLAFHIPGYSPHEQFFRPLISYALRLPDQLTGNDKIKSFLTSQKVCERTHDDKSLVVAVNSGEYL